MWTISGSLDGYQFGITGDEAVAAEYGVEGEAVVLLKKFDDGKAVLAEGITEEAVLKFVSSEALPLVIDFNHETAQKIFSGEVKAHLLTFLSAKAEGHEDKVNLPVIHKIFFGSQIGTPNCISEF